MMIYYGCLQLFLSVNFPYPQILYFIQYNIIHSNYFLILYYNYHYLLKILYIFRPPDTPLLNFYSTGTYTKPISFDQFKNHSAFPGPSSTIFERNKRESDEVNIKPITQTKIPQEYYNPKSYLKPFEISETPKDHQTPQLTSLHSTRIFNRKLAAQEALKKIDVSPGKYVSRDAFNNIKKQMSFDTMKNENKLEQHARVLPLVESHNYISQNENMFYQSSKINFKPTTNSVDKYVHSLPDYLRTSTKSKRFSLNNTANPALEKAEISKDVSVTIISKANGWLTVDPQTMSRKNAFEKKMKGDLHKTSMMSPSWMQTEMKPKDQVKLFKPISAANKNLRCENKRVLIAEKYEPPKSIFSYGHMRHNVLTKADADFNSRAISMQPTRLIEWKEEISKQRFDKKIQGKIGQQNLK